MTEIYNPTKSTIVVQPGTILAVVESFQEANIVGSFEDVFENNDVIEAVDSNVSRHQVKKGDTETTPQQVASAVVAELGIDVSDADLTNQQKDRLVQFLARHRNVFAKDMTEIGCTNLYEHSIDTGDAQPQKRCYSRLSPKEKLDVDKQIDEMLENGIISPCNSPWISPVILVAKKTGGYRFAIDYRLLNKVTKPLSFPPSLI
jgi:hypothetical protein